jgi:hypothetical protein
MRKALIPPMEITALMGKAYEPIAQHVEVVTYRVRRMRLFGEDVEFLAPADITDMKQLERMLVEKWFR